MVGKSGSALGALGAGHREAAQSARLTCGISGTALRDRDVDLARDQIGDQRSGAFVRDMRDVQTRHRLEELHREVARRAAATRRVVDLPGFDLASAISSGTDFAAKLTLDASMSGTATNWITASKSFTRVVADFLVQVGIDHVRNRREQNV
jgi:hypothetical protein